MPPVRAYSTTFGSSILPRTNGRGWAEAVRLCSLACTAHWVRLPPETFPEDARMLRAEPIAAAISGSLGAMVRMPMEMLVLSTTFGSSIRSRTNGRGWAEAARSPSTLVVNLACMARWVRLPPETSPEAAFGLRVGSTAAAISGSLGAMASMPMEMVAISTIFGSSILPQTNGRGWGEAARW